MAKVSSRDAQVNARIVYWGVEGAGKTANCTRPYELRPDHRGELRSVPTRLDPSVSYEVLPIELGDIAGVRTQIELIAVPGPAEQAPTRKQLLDQVDGVVFVVDSQPSRLDANIASFEELRRALRAYGRQIEDLPLLVQYNKRPRRPLRPEDLHRKLDEGRSSSRSPPTAPACSRRSTISKGDPHPARKIGPPSAPPPPAHPRDREGARHAWNGRSPRSSASRARRHSAAARDETLLDGPRLGDPPS
jgi:hypothetical protein